MKAATKKRLDAIAIELSKVERSLVGLRGWIDHRLELREPKSRTITIVVLGRVLFEGEEPQPVCLAATVEVSKGVQQEIPIPTPPGIVGPGAWVVALGGELRRVTLGVYAITEQRCPFALIDRAIQQGQLLRVRVSLPGDA